ncbi:putative leader peptide [Jiangella endophytica]
MGSMLAPFLTQRRHVDLMRVASLLCRVPTDV